MLCSQLCCLQGRAWASYLSHARVHVLCSQHCRLQGRARATTRLAWPLPVYPFILNPLSLKVGIFAGRVINIYVLSFVLNLARAKKISFRFQHMLVFAGLRGAIAFALAIRNTQEETRQLIFTTTLVIVMVTVFVCGGLTTLVLQLLRIK